LWFALKRVPFALKSSFFALKRIISALKQVDFALKFSVLSSSIQKFASSQSSLVKIDKLKGFLHEVFTFYGISGQNNP